MIFAKRLQFPSAGRRRGMTIVELLVAAGALAVIMGIAIGMMTESETASRRLTQHEFLVQECEQAVMAAARLVQAGVAPQNFTGMSNQSVLTPVFASDRLTLLAYDQEGGDYLDQVTIETSANAKDELATPVAKQQPVAEAAGAMPARVREKALLTAGSAGDYTTLMTFAYAKAPAPGAAPDYQDQWPSDQWPDLIRIAITGRSKTPGRPAIRLSTAVIPGGMKGGAVRPPAPGQPAALAATPTSATIPQAAPAPAPAATPAPAEARP